MTRKPANSVTDGLAQKQHLPNSKKEVIPREHLLPRLQNTSRGKQEGRSFLENTSLLITMSDKVATMMENQGFDVRYCNAVKQARKDIVDKRRAFKVLFRSENSNNAGLIGNRFADALKNAVSKGADTLGWIKITTEQAYARLQIEFGRLIQTWRDWNTVLDHIKPPNND